MPGLLTRSLPAALLAVLLTAPAASARIAATPEPGWMPDAAVSALASDGSTAFLAGTIYTIGPHTGSGAVLSARDGRADERVPPITGGAVEAVVADGRGGWFVGGGFDHVGRVARPGLVHLLADGRVDRRFDPRPDGTVRALARAGGTLYLAGDFTRIAGRTRAGLAAVRAATGAAESWHPAANGAVDALAIGRDRVFLGGRFTTAGGEGRRGAAAVDRASGRVLAWDAALDGPVSDVVVAGESVYLAGDFRRAGGAERPGLAEVSAADGAVSAWVPAVGLTSPVVAGDRIYGRADPDVVALDRRSGDVVAGSPHGHCGPCEPGPVAIGRGTVFSFLGSFNLIDDPGSRLEANEAGNLAPRPWSPTPPVRLSPTAGRPGWGDVRAIAVQGERVFVGGAFDIAGGVRRVGVAGLDLAGGRLSASDPGVQGASSYNPLVPAVAVGDGVVVADGDIDFGGGAFSTRGAGRLWSFGESGHGANITALAVAGETLFVGGYSSAVESGSGLFVVGLHDRGPLPWHPALDGPSPGIAVILPVGDTVYVGGTFTSGTHRNLAAFDATTGAIRDDFAPNPDGEVKALTLHDGRLYAGGAFTSVGGTPRRNLAALDPTTGATAPWDPSPTARSVRSPRAAAASSSAARSRTSPAPPGPTSPPCVSAPAAPAAGRRAGRPGQRARRVRPPRPRRRRVHPHRRRLPRRVRQFRARGR